MSNFDYETTERPVEPAFADEDPEQWVCIAEWEESRADYYEKKYKQLIEEMKRTNILLKDMSYDI